MPAAVAIVLPTYNEAENLREVVSRIRGAVPDARLIVVDDLSPDGTGAIADELARTDPRIEVLHREGERGLGRAVTAGLLRASAGGAELAITMDADLSHDPADIPRLLEAVESADIVLGSRYVAGGRTAHWPFHRRLLSASANLFVHVVFRLPAHDCTTGFRAYRRAVLERVPWHSLHSAGYSFQVEVLYWMVRLGSRGAREVPIVFTERARGRSKMGPRQALVGAADLLKLRAQLWRGRIPG